MTAFTYRQGELHVDDVPVSAIVAAVGTPFYVYSASAVRESFEEFRTAFTGRRTLIAYGMKANSSLAVLRMLGELGAGADIVSGGELKRALVAGIPGNRIVFSGVGKSDAELDAAIDAGVLQINLESESELDALAEIARARGVRVPVALRVNPDVDAVTHAKITTGRRQDKFGVMLEDAPRLLTKAAATGVLEPVAIAVHIGSQLMDLAPYRAAFARVASLVRELREAGIAIRRVDLGGGLGIDYGLGQTRPTVADYARIVEEALGGLDVELVLEPGRRLVGEAGALVARVVHVKETDGRRFIVLDAGMNDLIRPALYDAYHPLMPLREVGANAPRHTADIVGPICETGDTFARGLSLPDLERHEVVAFGAAGAYGAVMSNEYNQRPLPPEVLVDGARWAVTRRRPDWQDMMRLENLPPWL